MSLFARFDSQVLRVPPLHPVPTVALDPLFAQPLRAWCEASPHFDAAPAPQDAAQLEAFLRELDGDRLLRSLSRAQGLLLRLRVKAQDLRPGRQQQNGDIWDCGYLSAQGLQALETFQARRPTLIVTDPMSEASLLQAKRLLEAKQAGPALRLLMQVAP
jgi:hypothetical protein